MFQTRAKGFILVITIGIIGLLSSIVVRTVTKLTAFTALNGVLIQREQAKLFAISGIDFAISRLLTIYNPETDTSRTDKGENGIQKDPVIAAIQLQKAMSNLLNRWHTIPLTEAADGTITLYIACEQGKINIRSLYEHTNNEYKESLRLKLLKKPINDYFTQQIKDFNITTILKNIAQKKNGLHNLSDITQVFAQKQNTSLYRTLFLEQQSKMALYDLFSLEELETKPVPILAMSRSVATLFGLQIKNSISNKEWEDYTKLYKKQPADTAALIDAQLKLIYGKTIDFKGEVS